MAAARPRRKAPAKPALRMSALLGLQKVDLFKGLDSYTLREIAAQCKWTRCKREWVTSLWGGPWRKRPGPSRLRRRSPQLGK